MNYIISILHAYMFYKVNKYMYFSSCYCCIIEQHSCCWDFDFLLVDVVCWKIGGSLNFTC